jgi:hypothetical protein
MSIPAFPKTKSAICVPLFIAKNGYNMTNVGMVERELKRVVQILHIIDTIL